MVQLKPSLLLQIQDIQSVHSLVLVQVALEQLLTLLEPSLQIVQSLQISQRTLTPSPLLQEQEEQFLQLQLRPLTELLRPSLLPQTLVTPSLQLQVVAVLDLLPTPLEQSLQTVR